MARILKKDWLAVAVGEIYPVLHDAGSTLTGELLDRAEGLGLMVDDETPAQAKRRLAAEAKVAEEAEAARLAQEDADRKAAEEAEAVRLQEEEAAKEAAKKAAEGGAQ